MKTLFAESTQQTFETTAPTKPSTPLTEEIIIPSVNSIELPAPVKMSLTEDAAYPLAHRMVYDLVNVQQRVLDTGTFHDYKTVVEPLAEHVKRHIAQELTHGYLGEIDETLAFSEDGEAYVNAVASQYLQGEIAKMRTEGPNERVISQDYITRLREDKAAFAHVDTSEVTDLLPLHPSAEITVIAPASSEDATFDGLESIRKRFDRILRKAGTATIAIWSAAFHPEATTDEVRADTERARSIGAGTLGVFR